MFVAPLFRSLLSSSYRSFIPSIPRSYFAPFVRSFLHPIVPSFLHSCIPFFLRSYLPSLLCECPRVYALNWWVEAWREASLFILIHSNFIHPESLHSFIFGNLDEFAALCTLDPTHRLIQQPYITERTQKTIIR